MPVPGDFVFGDALGTSLDPWSCWDSKLLLSSVVHHAEESLPEGSPEDVAGAARRSHLPGPMARLSRSVDFGHRLSIGRHLGVQSRPLLVRQQVAVVDDGSERPKGAR